VVVWGGAHRRQFGPGAPPPITAPVATGPTSPRTTGGRQPVPTSTVPASAGPTTTGPAATTTIPVTMQLPPPAPPGSPAWVAAKFVQAYYGASWTWPSLGWWVVLARPYMTPALYARFHYLAVHATNPGDKAYLDQLRKDHTTYVVDVSETNVEADAPNTATKRYALVTYQLQAFGLNEPQSGAPYGLVHALQCVVVRSAPGSPWQVASFSSPDAN
jgi:hypothetical protein